MSEDDSSSRAPRPRGTIRFPELERLQEALRPAKLLAASIPRLNLPSGAPFRIGTGIGNQAPFRIPALTTAVEFPDVLGERIRRMAQAIRLPGLDGLFKTLAQERRLNGLGWLPHVSLPWEEIDAADDHELPSILERHYRDDWPAVRRAFERQLATYSIDEEAKATFREALAAHEAGLYRTTTRTLFPEIERVSRIELHGGRAKSYASQKELQDWAGDLLPREIAPPGRGGLELFHRLIEHLYVKVEQPEALDAMRGDPVPNRHAAVHGLVSYPSMQNSINALIMTDFVFQVICAVMQRRAEQEASASEGTSPGKGAQE